MKRVLSVVVAIAAMGLLSAKDSADVVFLRDLLRREYIRELPDSILMRPTVDSILQGCDYYTFRHTAWHISGFDNYYGATTRNLGLEFDRDKRGPYVRYVAYASAAYDAGVAVLDRVMAVNGTDVTDCAGWEVLRQIVECTDSIVTLTIRRGGRMATIPMRTGATRNTHVVDLIANGVAFIRIHAIGCITGDVVDRLLWNYSFMDIRRVVLDLRGCRGGYYEQSVDIVRPFARMGDTISVAHFRKAPKTLFHATAKGYLRAKPLDVLVDRATASGGEVIALGLESNMLCTMFGERTRGKGVMQSTAHLPSGTRIQYTRAYLTSAGNTCIDRVYGTNGLVPERPFEPDTLNRDTLAMVVNALPDLAILRAIYSQPTPELVEQLRSYLPPFVRDVRSLYVVACIWSDKGKLWWVAQHERYTAKPKVFAKKGK